MFAFTSNLKCSMAPYDALKIPSTFLITHNPFLKYYVLFCIYIAYHLSLLSAQYLLNVGLYHIAHFIILHHANSARYKNTTYHSPCFL